MITVTSREFNQDRGAVKKASEKEPVFITNRGRTSHVLLSYKQYQELAGSKKSVAELLAMPSSENIDLPLDRDSNFSREVDFS